MVKEARVPQWKDVSSYSQSDTDRTPNAFEFETVGWPTIRICVHRHRDYPGKWCLSCPDLLVLPRPLTAVEIEGAKKEALQRVALVLRQFLTGVEAGLSQYVAPWG